MWQTSCTAHIAWLTTLTKMEQSGCWVFLKQAVPLKYQSLKLKRVVFLMTLWPPGNSRWVYSTLISIPTLGTWSFRHLRNFLRCTRLERETQVSWCCCKSQKHPWISFQQLNEGVSKHWCVIHLVSDSHHNKDFSGGNADHSTRSLKTISVSLKDGAVTVQ